MLLQVILKISLIVKLSPHQNIPMNIYTLGIPIAGKAKDKEELETMLKRGTFFSDVIFDYEFFTEVVNFPG